MGSVLDLVTDIAMFLKLLSNMKINERKKLFPIWSFFFARNVPKLMPLFFSTVFDDFFSFVLDFRITIWQLFIAEIYLKRTPN